MARMIQVHPDLWVQKREEAQKLQEFKEYVHKRLDEMGIPTHPNGVHSKQGCRIGDRLDLLEVMKMPPEHSNPPAGYHPCTIPAPHVGPCAHRPVLSYKDVS
jgi:hypothetical protein